MKVLRDLFEHMQFVVVTLITAAMVVGLGLMGQYWLGPKEPRLEAERVPTTEPPLDPLDPALENTPQDPFLESLPQISPGVSPPAPSGVPSPPAAPSAPTASVPPAPSPAPASSTNLYGHLRYQEVPRSRLATVGQYVRGSYRRTEKLEQDAAAAFQRMTADAQSEGVRLMPISGFRTVSSQNQLFNRQIKRQGSQSAAAKLSAPPGHSEHHTGYAIDIADAKNPNTDLKLSFQSSDAYKWLVANGGRYGFELSFPRNNPQGVSFEPWHWRYIGSTAAQSTFKVAKGG